MKKAHCGQTLAKIATR